MGAEPNITGVTRGGTSWIPQFVTELNEETCIGCGRCYKVCPRDVLTIVQRGVDDVDLDDDDDDDDDSDNSFMTLSNAMDCIGCEACSRVCPKSCFTHSALPLAA